MSSCGFELEAEDTVFLIIYRLIMISAKILRGVLFWVCVAITAPIFGADPILPNLKLTPGVYRKNLNETQICQTKWGLDKRYVTLSMKKQVFAEYGIPYSRHSEFEVDHLISRELGGADDVRNVWPESYITLHSHGMPIVRIDSRTIYTSLSVRIKLRCKKRVEKSFTIGLFRIRSIWASRMPVLRKRQRHITS